MRPVRHGRRLPRRLRQPLAVQPRVPPQVRRPAQPGRRTPVRSGTRRRPLAAVNADAL